jgi:hypothetical protein
MIILENFRYSKKYSDEDNPFSGLLAVDFSFGLLWTHPVFFSIRIINKLNWINIILLCKGVKMKKLSVSSILVLLLLLAVFSTVAAASSRTVYKAPLSDLIGTGSDAHGNAVFVFVDDNSKLDFKLIVNGLDNVTMAHIHVAETPGGNGPVVLWLYPNTPPPILIEGTFNGLLGTGTADSDDLTGNAGVSTLADLRVAIEEGRAYVNVHTTAFPGGEIRGVID